MDKREQSVPPIVNRPWRSEPGGSKRPLASRRLLAQSVICRANGSSERQRSHAAKNRTCGACPVLQSRWLSIDKNGDCGALDSATRALGLTVVHDIWTTGAVPANRRSLLLDDGEPLSGLPPVHFDARTASVRCGLTAAAADELRLLRAVAVPPCSSALVRS